MAWAALLSQIPAPRGRTLEVDRCLLMVPQHVSRARSALLRLVQAPSLWQTAVSAWNHAYAAAANLALQCHDVVWERGQELLHCRQCSFSNATVACDTLTSSAYLTSH
jgi:hypothetical protein